MARCGNAVIIDESHMKIICPLPIGCGVGLNEVKDFIVHRLID